MNHTPQTSELTCKELVELITDYLEHVLSPADETRFELHLSVCDGCVAYVEQMRQAIGVIGRLDETALQPDAQAALLAAFRDWKTER